MAKQESSLDMEHNFTDEMLMAYVDGELEPDQRQRLQDAMESDPSLRDRVEVFGRTGRDLASLFDQPMNEPVPAHLLDLVRGAKVEPHRTGVFERGRDWCKTFLSGGMIPAPRGVMAAASVATFAVGLSLGVVLQNGGSQAPGDRIALLEVRDNQVWARGVLKDALETLVSGDILAASEDANLVVASLLTFKDKSNRFCREFAVGGSPEANATGIACRHQSGQWVVEAHLAHTRPDPDSDTFLPASGKGAGSLEALMTGMISGEPLSLEEEEASIEGMWK